MAEMSAMGKPVALDASAEEREVRGLISMMMSRSDIGVVCPLHVRAADHLHGFDDAYSDFSCKRLMHVLRDGLHGGRAE